MAERVAAAINASLVPFFFRDAEPSKVEGMGRFYNLTPAFAVVDGEGGRPWCRFVDDITINADLDRERPTCPGWLRIVSDDTRLLELATIHVDPEATVGAILEPIAELWETEVHCTKDGEMARVSDARGRPIAIASGLPGERERPCELVTAPLDHGDLSYLAELLGHASGLGFTLPTEAATHLHFDGAPLSDAWVLRNLAAIVVPYREVLRERFATNSGCVRLGPWSDALIDVVRAPDFSELAWPEASARLADAEPSKYCDVNIRNIVFAEPLKTTVEFRQMPGTLDVADVLRWVELCVTILERARCGPAIPFDDPGTLEPTEESRAALDALLGGGPGPG